MKRHLLFIALAFMLMPVVPVHAEEPDCTTVEECPPLVEQEDKQLTATMELSIVVDEKPIDDIKPIVIYWGKTLQLTVQTLHTDGELQDVTRSPKIAYFSITPWSLTINSTGLVKAVSAEDFATLDIDRTVGAVTVTYGVAGDRDVGIKTVMFSVLH